MPACPRGKFATSRSERAGVKIMANPRGFGEFYRNLVSKSLWDGNNRFAYKLDGDNDWRVRVCVCLFVRVARVLIYQIEEI